MTPALKALLDLIRKHEAPKGYGQIFIGAKGVPKDTDVTKLTLKEVRILQEKMVINGSVSSACGGYQFIRKTLAATMLKMGLTGDEIWTPELQDRMAVYLCEQRGLKDFLAGKLGINDFANNLAKEWASLPVVSGPKKGKSHYAGDGLNRSLHDPETILKALRVVREEQLTDPGAYLPNVELPAPPLGLPPETVVFKRSSLWERLKRFFVRMWK
jgi:muramidase (phage lysozyme)